MSIHTLHDLCYAYAVADPVREMLFALQDRITELEAQRKPLSDEMVHKAMMALNKKSYGELQPTFEEMKAAIEAAHGIKEGT